MFDMYSFFFSLDIWLNDGQEMDGYPFLKLDKT